MVAHSGGTFFCACEEDGYPCDKLNSTPSPYCYRHTRIIQSAAERDALIAAADKVVRDAEIAAADKVVRTLAVLHARRAEIRQQNPRPIPRLYRDQDPRD